MLTPYDFQENLQQRAQYIRNRLRAGSPVIGISYDNGVLLLALKRRGRKVYEVYDRLMFSAIGNQADVENLRLAAIDFAHQEGFVRSPDDVTIQRVVGFALSPALKRRSATRSRRRLWRARCSPSCTTPQSATSSTRSTTTASFCPTSGSLRLGVRRPPRSRRCATGRRN